MTQEKATWHAHATLEKYDEDGNLYETIEIEDANLLVNDGINLLESRLVGTTPQWQQTYVGLGVGNGTTSEAATQQDLLGASKYYAAMEAGFPTGGVSQKLTFKAVFGDSIANFDWREYGVVVPGTGASAFAPGATKPANYTLLNRKVENLGTKSSGTWTLTVEITIA